MIPEIGDRVLYRTDGICRVTEVRKESFAASEEKRDYYILKPDGDPGATFFVPSDNADLMGQIRPLLLPDEAARLLKDLPNDNGREEDWIPDSRERTEIFKRIMNGCERSELLRLARLLVARRNKLTVCGRKLAGTDETTLKKLMKLLTDEFSLVLDMNREDVSEMLLAGIPQTTKAGR